MNRTSKKTLMIKESNFSCFYQSPGPESLDFLTSKSTKSRAGEIGINPFDNMKTNGKSHPSLRPILNKRNKRYANQENKIKTSLSDKKHQIVSSSLANLPLFYKPTCENRASVQKFNLPPIELKDSSRVSIRNISTPYFSEFNGNTKRGSKGHTPIPKTFSKKKIECCRESYPKMKFEEVSFGETGEYTEAFSLPLNCNTIKYL
ncbi:hypothetical protein SteCoe_3546 [Stentor coeruleus]|uniref:Uncharacterized protein n=1 Tax=Stentor coeruleus TaxID=5963 RepID=A0A1R2CWU0_9CILI|nr:hypothetical protein SteCoe_3546 [Stentor coeruleus]